MKTLAALVLAVALGVTGCAGDDPAPGVTGAASTGGADGGMAGASGGASEVDGGGGGSGGAPVLPACALQVTSFYGCYPGPRIDDCNPDPVSGVCTYTFPGVGCMAGNSYQQNCIAKVAFPAFVISGTGESIPARTDTVTCLSASMLRCPASTQ